MRIAQHLKVISKYAPTLYTKDPIRIKGTPKLVTQLWELSGSLLLRLPSWGLQIPHLMFIGRQSGP